MNDRTNTITNLKIISPVSMKNFKIIPVFKGIVILRSDKNKGEIKK